jgi:hypothetical protein
VYLFLQSPQRLLSLLQFFDPMHFLPLRKSDDAMQSRSGSGNAAIRTSSSASRFFSSASRDCSSSSDSSLEGTARTTKKVRLTREFWNPQEYYHCLERYAECQRA